MREVSEILTELIEWGDLQAIEYNELSDIAKDLEDKLFKASADKEEAIASVLEQSNKDIAALKKEITEQKTEINRLTKVNKSQKDSNAKKQKTIDGLTKRKSPSVSHDNKLGRLAKVYHVGDESVYVSPMSHKGTNKQGKEVEHVYLIWGCNTGALLAICLDGDNKVSASSFLTEDMNKETLTEEQLIFLENCTVRPSSHVMEWAKQWLLRVNGRNGLKVTGKDLICYTGK